jgi:polyisoprenoid-binding protein YceI
MSRKILRIAVIGCLAALPAAVSHSPHHSPPLTISGTSTVRSWECGVPTYRLSVWPDSGYAGAVLDQDKALDSLRLSVPVDSIDCGIGTMNSHMREALQAQKYPSITFRLHSYDLEPASPGVEANMKGSLTIDDATKPVSLDVHLTPNGKGGLDAKGRYSLNMEDYGVKPPSLFFGTLTVGKTVTVAFDVNATLDDGSRS